MYISFYNYTVIYEFICERFRICLHAVSIVMMISCYGTQPYSEGLRNLCLLSNIIRANNSK
jgi:hypothetical protein